MIGFRDLLDKHYKLGGRGPDYYDCYGLVKEMYRRYGKEIPEYYSSPDFAEIAKKVNLEANKANTRWHKITKEESTRVIRNAFGNIYIKPHCLIVLRMGRFGCHIGFILNELQFIHCWDRADSVIIERIDYWKNNILGAYDYE